ncbi:MAG: NAD kinase [Rhodospirillaceae bacterium]|jgi:NAD+ kinase|nr:NAD kinase [Rhodospirillaceae bacterium]
MRFTRVSFVAADNDVSQQALKRLRQRYGVVNQEDADSIIVLGGDGFMLETLHDHIYNHIPVYGMNRGTIGFLLNVYTEDNLMERLERAEIVRLHPLIMNAITVDGQSHEALAINEVSLLRETRQAAKIRIHVNDKVRLEKLICDGVLLSTPVGSTAYNLSAHGPIIPMGAKILALTSISAFRPRRWRGALLSHKAKVLFEILESEKRCVKAIADYMEVRNVVKVKVYEDCSTYFDLLFDPERNLEERILTEQFIQ